MLHTSSALVCIYIYITNRIIAYVMTLHVYAVCGEQASYFTLFFGGTVRWSCVQHWFRLRWKLFNRNLSRFHHVNSLAYLILRKDNFKVFSICHTMLVRRQELTVHVLLYSTIPFSICWSVCDGVFVWKESLIEFRRLILNLVKVSAFFGFIHNVIPFESGSLRKHY